MSEENNETIEATAPVRPSKASVSADDVAPLVAGISSYEKAAFRVYGQKGGARLTLPKTQKIARAYFYGTPPEHRAITVFSEDERKDKKLGGVTAAVDFSQGSEAALEAIAALADVVRKAPVVQPKPAKEEPASETTEAV